LRRFRRRWPPLVSHVVALSDSGSCDRFSCGLLALALPRGLPVGTTVGTLRIVLLLAGLCRWCRVRLGLLLLLLLLLRWGRMSLRVRA
jgi:hypothetical protein